jgi:hypothetical protein
MKIHKLNLENYYRNLMMESLKLRGTISSYTTNPQYTEVVFTCNANDTVTVGIPSLSESAILVRNSNGLWENKVKIEYATATIVGLTSDKSIPLGEFSLQQDANGIAWVKGNNDPTLNLFTIPTTVNKLKVVISFKSFYQYTVREGKKIVTKTEYLISNDSIEAMTVNIKREDNSGSSPVSFVDYDETGGGSTITVDSSMSDTSENPVQNKVIYAAIAQLQSQIGTINDTLNTVLHG